MAYQRFLFGRSQDHLHLEIRTDPGGYYFFSIVGVLYGEHGGHLPVLYRNLLIEKVTDGAD